MTTEDTTEKKPDAADAEPPAEAKPEAKPETPKEAVGTKVTLYFSLDDILKPAVEQELGRRGWTRAAINGLKPKIHESALLGFDVDLERTE